MSQTRPRMPRSDPRAPAVGSGSAETDNLPYSPAKRAAILEGATRVFLVSGYARASMDAIAGAAGVSKATVYNHFGSKEKLFEAICRDRCERLSRPLRTLPDDSDDPETALTAVARQYMDLLFDASSLALYRMLIAEVTRNPTLGAASYHAGPHAAAAELAAYLARQDARGRLEVADPELAAEQFFGMLNGHQQVRALLCVEQAPSRRRADRVIASAVRTFLRGHAPSD